MTDYEIFKNTKLLPIEKVLEKYGVSSDEVIPYGKYMAKLDLKEVKPKGKLILVTSTNPTPYGEGKTTLAIGICDALCKNGYKAMLALREPSLGPVFGTKGGATGGGQTQIAPMDDINLHFTGDFHAITSANNLIAAVIDNHIYQGNELKIDKVYFQRCLDLNDRALKSVTLQGRTDHFTITAASEIMAIFTLFKDEDDLRRRLDNILIGEDVNGKPIYLKQLGVTGAVMVLLKDAIKPNVVQTLKGNAAIVHGGPFANIAHGCNSVVATKMAMSLSDYAITEAGFGSDMGALKFLDIKCSQNNIYPDLIVVNSTVRSLKYHGNGVLEKGIENLKFHILNMKQFHDNVLVIINRFTTDTEEEINYLKDYCEKLGVKTLVSNMYSNGDNDTEDLAKTIVSYANKENTKRCHIYDLEDDIFVKIDKYCKNIFHAKEVIYKNDTRKRLENLPEQYKKYRICISKTPLSITDDKNVLGYPKDFVMTVTDIKINSGSEFITILMGNVLTMPGLSKDANYLHMDYRNGNIEGLF